ncbi:hypothetical protein [Maribacter flavus]|uniref:Uncharacterized protein n=1 Tax=Maribacter flavus TaxID=1658664 RepID=A0A5B2TYA8_9FLAO|nr:hypothetical protein [Maribacter flavus]KAA2218815.1 hypothetical protein F0361_04095 [Maribacter flavus]
MMKPKNIWHLFLILLVSIFICCKDSKTGTKNAMEPSSQNTLVTESTEKTDNQTSRDYAKIDAGNDIANIEKLKETFRSKNEVLFLEQFPSDQEQFMQHFGWNYKSNQPNELYEESYAYIDYFFNLLSQDKYKKFESKFIDIAKDGSWQEDAINYFQDKTLNFIKTGKRYDLINTLSSDEAKSVLFFLFDGPHPKFDAEFASHLSPSKKEILEELFKTGFYDHNENPDLIMPDLEEVDPIDDEGSIHHDISDFEGAEHFFIRDIDINNDGVLDKIVSADPYQGDELFLFENVGGEYQHTLKTINFSEDGGNQIVDVIAENSGFYIKTAFPDGGLLEADYHITFKNNAWVLTHTVYRTQSSNQENAVIYVCNVVQELNLEDADFFERLKGMPYETDRERLCSKEKMN